MFSVTSGNKPYYKCYIYVVVYTIIVHSYHYPCFFSLPSSLKQHSYDIDIINK